MVYVCLYVMYVMQFVCVCVRVCVRVFVCVTDPQSPVAQMRRFGHISLGCVKICHLVYDLTFIGCSQ